ncbi:hypothetical protein pdam_00006655, partial [Pocillopora damicornis]
SYRSCQMFLYDFFLACASSALLKGYGNNDLKGCQWMRENFSLQSQYNIKHRSDENKIKYQLGDYESIQYQILQIDIIIIAWQTVRRITNEILGVKGSLTWHQPLLKLYLVLASVSQHQKGQTEKNK